MRNSCNHFISLILGSSKFNSTLRRSRYLTYTLFFLFKIQYIYGEKEHTLRHILGPYTLLDNIFIKLFEYYFFHQCCQYNFQKAYFLKYVIITSIHKNLLVNDQISRFTIDVWMLILESSEYRGFVGLDTSDAQPLLSELTVNRFRFITQAIVPQYKSIFPHQNYVKLIGPVDDVNSVIKQFNHFICLKPYRLSQLQDKSGVFFT